MIGEGSDERITYRSHTLACVSGLANLFAALFPIYLPLLLCRCARKFRGTAETVAVPRVHTRAFGTFRVARAQFSGVLF